MSATENSPPIGSLAYLDWRYGFLDLKFEQRIEDFPPKESAYVYDSPYDREITGYSFPEKRQVGQAWIETINCLFFRNKLYYISCEVVRNEGVLEKEGNNVRAFWAILQEAYGQPTIVERGAWGWAKKQAPGKCYWKGARVTADLVCRPRNIWHSTDWADASFTIYSQSICDAANAYSAEQRKLRESQNKVVPPSDAAKLL